MQPQQPEMTPTPEPPMIPQMQPPAPGNSQKKHGKLIIIIVASVLLAAGIGVTVFLLIKNAPGPSQTSQSTSVTKTDRPKVDEEKTFEKGSVASFGHFEATLNKQTPNYQFADGTKPTSSDKQFLVLNLTFKNVDTEAHLLSDIDLGVLDGTTIINPTYLSVDPPIRPGAIEAGKSVTGNMVFEVPTNAADLKLYYNTQIYSEQDKKLKNIQYLMPL